MNRISDEFDEALMSNTSSDELRPFLQLTEQLKGIPKRTPPMPQKRFSYIKHLPTKQPSFWRAWRKTFSIASAFASFALIVFGTVQAANKSLPGEPLFALKKVIEKSQLAIISNPDKQADSQLALAEKRLEEVSSIIGSNNPSLEAAAIAELTAQTQSTLETVRTVATNNAVEKKDNRLVENLAELTKKQEALLDKLPKGEDNKSTTAVADATEASKTAVDELRKIYATVNDQALADLTEVTISGVISQASETSITVDKQVITLTDTTVITHNDSDGTVSLLKNKAVVTITASKQEDGTIAKQITIIELAPKPVVDLKTQNKSGILATDTLEEEFSAPIEETQKTQVKAGLIPENP